MCVRKVFLAKSRVPRLLTCQPENVSGLVVVRRRTVAPLNPTTVYTPFFSVVFTLIFNYLFVFPPDVFSRLNIFLSKSNRATSYPATITTKKAVRILISYFWLFHKRSSLCAQKRIWNISKSKIQTRATVIFVIFH